MSKPVLDQRPGKMAEAPMNTVGGAPDFVVPRYVAALLAFLAGALAGGWTANLFTGSTRRRWLLTVAGVEAVLFFGGRRGGDRIRRPKPLACIAASIVPSL